jgi:hypothetical protein
MGQYGHEAADGSDRDARVSAKQQLEHIHAGGLRPVVYARDVHQAREADRQGRSGAVEAAPAATASERVTAGGWLVCKPCSAFIAELRSRIEVNGAHAHSFINPAGLIFRVGCHASAPGVLGIGEKSEHWSWFPGFCWQAAVCRACAQHLGWCFEGPHARFVALILDRVVERDPPRA